MPANVGDSAISSMLWSHMDNRQTCIPCDHSRNGPCAWTNSARVGSIVQTKKRHTHFSISRRNNLFQISVSSRAPAPSAWVGSWRHKILFHHTLGGGLRDQGEACLWTQFGILAKPTSYVKALNVQERFAFEQGICCRCGTKHSSQSTPVHQHATRSAGRLSVSNTGGNIHFVLVKLTRRTARLVHTSAVRVIVCRSDR